ncbi:MAG: DNA repair protein RadC [Chromatiales bacterium]|nr:DNA repair protein RadC [Chromatiales bacterium]
MTIKHWPDKERPREKLLAYGVENLSDAELLAILINSGTSGISAIDLARQLLKNFGSLRAIAKANKKDLCRNKGIGDVYYARLQAALEITRRMLLESMKKKDTVASPDRARKYLTLKMRNYSYEVFACLFLDNQHRVIAFEELFRGTIDGASVHPREVVKRTLHHNAAAVILVHNHPSGSSEPSHADRHITEELKNALALIDVRILDHFVVGEKVTSFTESNLL